MLRFEIVKSSQVRSGKCAKCGKRTRRVVTVEKTVNPFNRTEQGPKTRAEVVADVRSELAERVKAPLLCSTCEAP